MAEIVDMLSQASMGAPAILAIVRYPRFGYLYKPFFWLLIAGLFAEILTMLLDTITPASSAAVNKAYNIYIIFEFFLILWLFYVWDPLRAKYKTGYRVIIIAALAIWVLDNFLLNKFQYTSGLIRIFNAFTICLLGVNQVNRLLIHEKKSVLRNPVFIISCALIFYFIYKILVEVFYMHTGSYFSAPLVREKDKPPSPALALADYIYNIQQYVNIFFNVILAYAILCLPRKHIYFSRQ